MTYALLSERLEDLFINVLGILLVDKADEIIAATLLPKTTIGLMENAQIAWKVPREGADDGEGTADEGEAVEEPGNSSPVRRRGGSAIVRKLGLYWRRFPMRRLHVSCREGGVGGGRSWGGGGVEEGWRRGRRGGGMKGGGGGGYSHEFRMNHGVLFPIDVSLCYSKKKLSRMSSVRRFIWILLFTMLLLVFITAYHFQWAPLMLHIPYANYSIAEEICVFMSRWSMDFQVRLCGCI